MDNELLLILIIGLINLFSNYITNRPLYRHNKQLKLDSEKFTKDLFEYAKKDKLN